MCIKVANKIVSSDVKRQFTSTVTSVTSVTFTVRLAIRLLSSHMDVYMWLRMLAYEVTQFLPVLCCVFSGYVFCLAERTVSYAGQPFGD